MRLRPLFIGFMIISSVAFVFPTKAQAVAESSILVNMIPSNPAPGDNVTINLSSYVSNLDSVMISWSVNGKTSTSGIGKKSFSLNAPAAGLTTNVLASISLPDGRIDTPIIIRPAVMVLLWQANDSYVPPFYKGKAMPSPDSAVKVVAMPEVKTKTGMVDATGMVYAWQKDYNNDQGASGYGKNSYVYDNDYLDSSNNIDVIASTTDQSFSSEANITINTTDPKIEFYKNDPTLGTIWEQTLQNGHTITGDEVVQAAPYFISPQNIITPSLVWTWSINDLPVTTSIESINMIPLKVATGTTGTSKLKLQIDNSFKIFETASKEININF